MSCSVLFPSLVLIAAVLLVAGCTPRAELTPSPVTLRIAGSSSMGPVLAELASAYQQQHQHILIKVDGGGSTQGLNELISGELDVAAVSWLPDDQAVPENVQAAPLARDAMAVIVHPSNAIAGLTILQLRSLYQGQAADWAGLGGTAGEPLLISREEGSGTRAAFESMVMGGERVTLNALVMPTSQAVTDYVAGHRDAVGYVSMSSIDARVRAVPIEADLPTADSLESGAYHLVRLLYLVVAEEAVEETRGFLEYALSPAGQAIVGRHHAPIR